VTPRTAAAGAAMLRMGGTGADAAVAATFASFVAEVPLVNIGGGGMAMLVDGGETTVYDFFSSMPSGVAPHLTVERASWGRARIGGGGYRVKHWPGRNMFFGGAHAVGREHGRLAAAGDRRRGGSVAVVD